MTSYDTLKEYRKAQLGAVRASKGVASEDINERNNSRNYAGKVANDLGSRLDADKPTEVDKYLMNGLAIETDVLNGYFGENKATIIGDAPDSKLAKKVLEIPYFKIGSNPHDETVVIHEKYSGLAKLVSDITKGDESPDKAFAVVKPYIEQDVDKRLSEATNPRNKYIKAETKKMAKEAVLDTFARSPQMTVGKAVGLVNEAKKEFEARFPDADNERHKANYARENITKLAESKPNDAIGILTSLDN